MGDPFLANAGAELAGGRPVWPDRTSWAFGNKPIGGRITPALHAAPWRDRYFLRPAAFSAASMIAPGAMEAGVLRAAGVTAGEGNPAALNAAAITLLT